MGITDVVEIIAELRVELRLLPAVFSRLLSYSGLKQIAKVAEARVRLSDGAEVRVISAGSNEEADTAV
jgi:hypothetical protein